MHKACAALLNPSSAEPLVWPSPLKFISELNQDAKVLLERALMEANKEREKSILKGTGFAVSPSHSDAGAESDISEVTNNFLCPCSRKRCLTSFQMNKMMESVLIALELGVISRFKDVLIGRKVLLLCR